MSHMIQAVIFPRNATSLQTIRDRAKQTLDNMGLGENESYRLSDCYNVESFVETLDKAETAGDAVLLIVEPSTRRSGSNVIPAIERYLKRRPNSADGVILVVQGGVWLDAPSFRRLPITRKQIIRKLDTEGINQLDSLVKAFVKVDLERGLTDYNHYATLLQTYKAIWRSPLIRSSVVDRTGHPHAHSQDDVASFNANTQAEQQNVSPEEVRQKWRALAEEIKGRATALFDATKGAPLTEESPKLATIHALLHLWVEVRLYALRAHSNYVVYHEASRALLDKPNMAQEPLRRIPPGFGISQQRFSVFKDVDDILKDYKTTLANFDTALSNVTAQRKPFRHRMGDAEQFRMWRKQFGPDEISPDIEPGWDVQAASAYRELDYHYRDALRHEYWLSGYTASAVIMEVFRFIAGYGLRPQKTVYITIGVILGFMVGHWGDDAISGCAISTPHSIPILSGLQYYFSVSISSLTSLGSIAVPCGAFHGSLLALETLFGYFLLAVLTTLFVQSLSNR